MAKLQLKERKMQSSGHSKENGAAGPAVSRIAKAAISAAGGALAAGTPVFVNGYFNSFQQHQSDGGVLFQSISTPSIPGLGV